VRSLPLITLAGVGIWIAAVLVLDRSVGHTGQSCARPNSGRAGRFAGAQPRTVGQTLAVVAIATVGEVIGSLVWGLYSYRLDNLPAFVPPGHGLVYLAGLSLASLLATRTSALLVAAGVVAAGWGIAGVTVLPAPDASGTMGCAFLIAVLIWSRRPVYAGVFMVVVALELYGTAIGTWTWEPVVPGLRLSQGNPPSGVASGYVWFDVMAVLVARLGVGRCSSRGGRSPPADDDTGRISSRAESTLPQASHSRNPRALPSPST
jgi:hypothetical protein